MADEIATLITQVGLTNESFLALVVLIVIVIGAIIVIVASRPVLDMYPYLNPIARVRARKGRLFDEKQLSELIEAEDVGEITNYLRNSPDYGESLEIYPLDKALDVQLAENYDLLSRIAPKEVQGTFKALALKSDINNIKSLIAAKAAGLNFDETSNLLIPSGGLYDTLEQIVDVSSVGEVVNALDGTEYYDVLEDSLSKYEESSMILPLESSLDKYYLENLLASLNVPSNNNTTILYSYVGSQIDIFNIQLVIRSKADGLTYDDIESYVIKEGYNIKEWKLKDLMESENVGSVVGSLDGTDYSAVLSDALSEYESTGSIVVFENALNSYLLDYAHSLAIRNPLGVGPIIGFLNDKEKEIKNLKIITRAKREVNFPISKIQEMLV